MPARFIDSLKIQNLLAFIPKEFVHYTADLYAGDVPRKT